MRLVAPASRPLTAFVFAGGASLGALQVGMLRALYERGITADLLVGTSAGALNAGFVASRPQTVATADALARVWRGLQRDDIFPVSMRALVGGLRGQRDHVVEDRALRRLVRRHIEFDDLAQASTPVHVVAYDVFGAREVRLSDGPALDAILAAASIPGILPPVTIDGRQLVDGGVVNNTPISHAVELGAERIYVLPTRDRSCPPARAPRSALDAAIHGLSLLIDGRLEADIARYSRETDLTVLPAPNPLQVQPSEFGQASRLIRDALGAAHEMLSDLEARPRQAVA